MKFAFQSKRQQGMTFVKILLLIVIVAILSALLLPVSSPSRPTIGARAKMEIASLSAAIQQYQIVYNRLPGTRLNQTSDFTYGTWETSAAGIGITNAVGPQANNSEIMAALMDMTEFPNGKPTQNVNHAQNPQQTSFLNLRVNDGTNSPGLGADGVYRDPWGHPYIITISYNNSNRCRDAFYRLASVSENVATGTGINGLERPTSSQNTNSQTRDSFEYSGQIMIWSLGPDGKADPNQKATNGVNRDNILSW